MEKRRLLFLFLAVSIIVLLSLSIVSAAWYSGFVDFWNKITGRVVGTPCPCPLGEYCNFGVCRPCSEVCSGLCGQFPNGCDCGNCPAGYTCRKPYPGIPHGWCVGGCTPNCGIRVCGPDVCGGTCPPGCTTGTCVNGQCIGCEKKDSPLGTSSETTNAWLKILVFSNKLRVTKTVTTKVDLVYIAGKNCLVPKIDKSGFATFTKDANPDFRREAIKSSVNAINKDLSKIGVSKRVVFKEDYVQKTPTLKLMINEGGNKKLILDYGGQHIDVSLTSSQIKNAVNILAIPNRDRIKEDVREGGLSGTTIVFLPSDETKPLDSVTITGTKAIIGSVKIQTNYLSKINQELWKTQQNCLCP